MNSSVGINLLHGFNSVYTTLQKCS